jgi:hypothetical protein
MDSRHLKIYNLALFLGISPSLAGELEFNRDIRPILSENCFLCHGPDKHKREAKLRLDTREGALKMDAIVPGNPDDSEIIYRILEDDPDEIMPPPDSHRKLTKEQIAILKQWVKEGAKYQDHWSFVPPLSTSKKPLREVIDQQIQQELKKSGVEPSPSATQEALVRRLSLDLRGIPPTLEEIDSFLADSSDNPWEKLVDRMLASPQSAERLALDWLDVARYSDTNGYSIDDHREMWGWRDWVIHAFMENKPYDEFITEQLAGDLIPNATPLQKMATGFLRNSMNTHEGGTIAEEYRVAYIADKIDTVSSTFMGLTMKCAQCHDHKYDPISQEDYYRFYAFFDSATEHGNGATNGNTAPFIQVKSPLHEISDIEGSLKQRAARIRQLRNDLIHTEPGKYDAWKTGILAKATTLVSKPADKSSDFKFPPAGQAPNWVWADKKSATGRMLVRKNITLNGVVESAYAFFTCDNSADLYVNGKKLSHAEPWMEPKTVEITRHLKKGENTIAADARNAGGQAGFLAVIQLKYKSGEIQYTTSGEDWQWKPPTGDDPIMAFASESDWKNVVSLGKHGVAPWGELQRKVATPLPDQSLVQILNKDPEARSDAEKKRVTDEYITKASVQTKRLGKALLIELGIIEKQIKNSDFTSVMVMDNPGKRKTRMLIRGEYNNPGEEVSAGVPEVFVQLPEEAPADRLALARWLTSDQHPLTARVTVNRYWQMIFGAGVVRTNEDFGSQGEWPSHPELIDTLAVRFRDGGWDLKKLIKEIVMSQTYRQRSDISPELLEADPANRMLARAPRVRLSAELVRDNALAISGLLNPQLGGPSVYPEQPDGLWRQISHFGYGAFTAQAYFQDAGKQTQRRSMYSFWKRTSPPPGLAIFDAPTRETCTVRRMQTNTPLQALVLLNDPQFLKAARALAMRMTSEGGSSAEERIAYAFRLATARTPNAKELEILSATHVREKQRFTQDPQSAKDLLDNPDLSVALNDLAAHTMVASAILNLNETITKQ